MKLLKYNLPENTNLTVHIKNSKEGFDAVIYYNKDVVNTVNAKLLNVSKEKLKDGLNIDCIVKDYFLVKKDSPDVVIYDYSDKKTVLGKSTFIDVCYNRETNIISFKFKDLLLRTGQAQEKQRGIFARRNSFVGILHDDGEVNLVRYAPLHEHSAYSIDDGINKISAIAENSEYYGALTDHGNMYGTLKFESAMQKVGKKPIFGFEGYIEDFDDDIKFFTNQELKNEEEILDYKRKHCHGRHILFLAKNKTGLSNLIKLTTEGQLFKYNRPHIRYDILEKYHEGIICTSACFGGTLPKALLKKDNKLVDKYINQMIQWFGKDDFYIEIQRHENKEMIEKRVSEHPIHIDDLRKMNIDFINPQTLGPEIVKELKEEFKEDYQTEIEIFQHFYANYKLYIRSRRTLNISEYIDFICSLANAFNKHREDIINKFNFKTDEKYFLYDIDKKLISDVLYYEEEEYVNKQLIKLANKHGLKIIATIDSHYTAPEDSYLHEIWLCKQGKKMKMNNPARRQFPGEHYELISSEDMVNLFSDMPEALDNTLEIAEKCNVSLKTDEYFLPEFPLPEGFTSQMEYFKHLCSKGFAERFKGTPKYRNKEYLDRMKFEIETIERMGFPSYFLIVQDFIKWAQDDNVAEHVETYFPKQYYNLNEIPDVLKAKDFKIYIGPGRGSAAGSLVAYCLGITQIDPIEFDLLFERFLNPSRVSMPDIDTDIDDELRHYVFNYTRAKYGNDHTSRIITFTTAQPKAAIGIIQRILDFPIELKDKISDVIPSAPKTTFESTMKESAEFNELYNNDADVKKVVDIAKKFEGLPTGVSQHACGFLITPTPVTDYIPQIILKDKQGIPQLTTQWDKDECEACGCLKMDFLGLRTLSLIRHSLDYINIIREKNGENPMDIYDIPLYDKEVYKFISTGDTGGVFQIESGGMKNLMMQLYRDANSDNFTGKEGFNRLSAAIALYRPGPMDEIPNYIANMQNQDNIHYETPLLKKRLADTYGVIVYQEQAMLICRDLAGFSEAQADKVRKGMAKKVESILKEYREYFIYGSVDKGIKGCINNGIEESVAISIWDKMEKFGRYAFNKSHSVAYAVIVVYTAWLAYYYPNIYMSTLLTSFSKDADRIKEYLNITKNKGIKILPPDINKSDVNYKPEGSDVRIGLEGIKGVGKITHEIINERNKNGVFYSLVDLIERMIKAKHPLSSDNIEALIYSGTLDCFDGTRQAKINSIDNIMEVLSPVKQAYTSGQMTLFDFVINNPRLNEDNSLVKFYKDLKTIKIVDESEMPKLEMLKKEKECAGIYITEHPIASYSDILKKENYVSIEKFLPEITEDSYGNSIIKFSNMALRKQFVKIAGVITEENTYYTKKDNKPLSVFTVEDETGSIDCVCFDETRKTCKELIEENNLVAIEGQLQVRDERTQLVIKSIIPINQVGKKSGTEKVIIFGSSDSIDEARKSFKHLSNILQQFIATDDDFPTTVIFKDVKSEIVNGIQTYKVTTEIGSYKIKWSQDLMNKLANNGFIHYQQC